MSEAETAKANAIPLELKKDGLRQRQNGDWTITFTVQASDMDTRLVSAAMGTRYVAALVELNHDETPKETKREWRDLKPSAQAGIRCDEPAFKTFLGEEYSFEWEESFTTADAVRRLCEVKSRSELNTVHAARVLWHQLDEQYQAWKLM